MTRQARAIWYGFAVAVVGCATILKLLLPDWMAEDSTLLFFAAISLAVWRGGVRPGVLAVVLSSLSQAYFFLPPLLSFRIADPKDAMQLGVWALEGFLLCGLWGSLDSTKRRAAEALRAEALLRLVFEASPVPMYVFEIETTRFLAVNDAALQLYGYERDEFLARTLRDLRLPAEAAPLQNAEGGDDWAGSICHRKRDGAKIELEISSRALLYQGKTARIVATKDVTKQQRLEEQLRLAQKMEAIARLAGGIAHDFNNMLNVLLGYSVMLLEDLPSTDPTHEPLSEMKSAAQRCADLTRQLLAFSSQEPQAPQLLNLNDAVSTAEKFVRRVVGEDVEVVTHLSSEPCQVMVDPGQLEQVIMNLVVNARDAMAHGGKLTIETEIADFDESYAALHNDVAPGRYVVLAVSDNGMGMDSETQIRIFEPFFTTKEQGKGTGLGLAMVFGIVHQFAGHIGVYSEVGTGTTFKVYIPVAGQSALTSVPTIPMTLAGSETILLVEDEAQVRKFIQTVLRRLGYRVLAAAHPGEAILLAEKHAAEIDLLLTDVIMPHMNGQQLVDRLLLTRPELKVIFMSGYTDSVALDLGVSKAFAFVQKPVTPERLSGKVRMVLDATAAVGSHHAG